MKVEINDDLKKFSEVLTKEECKILIGFMEEKIKFLEKDTATLHEERDTYVTAMKRFMDRDAANEIIKKVGDKVKMQIVNQNKLFTDIILGTKELKLVNITPKLRKSINSRVKSLRKLLKEANMKLDFKIDEESDVIKDGECRSFIIDILLRELDYLTWSESADKRYYKNLINKIKNDSHFRRSEGEELWCMCDNRKSNPEIVEKIREYIKTLSEDEDDD